MNAIHRQKKAGHADWHPADIVCALRKAGWTYRQLSIHHGYHENALASVMARPWPHAQRLVADAIGVEPWEIWPSRYSGDRTPIRQRPRAPLTHYWSTRKVGATKDPTPPTPSRNGCQDEEI